MPTATSFDVATVAPYTGAWIETRNNFFKNNSVASHPIRVRGLKLVYLVDSPRLDRRTLYGCVD